MRSCDWILGILYAVLGGHEAVYASTKSMLCRSRFFVHRFSIGAVSLLLFTGELTQEFSHNFRALVCLLLNLAFANRVERPEEPHFLQVADECLQVLCSFDLRGETS